ncbi:MAG TPA: zf-HC2 domain-containing protein [Terriglobales bacterium]|nr:zf-HC2 domain-containing protein [Terriglobales bacterium]
MIVEISCIEVWREISNFIDDDVDTVLRDRMELHFKHCKHCTAILEGASNTVRLVADDQAFDLPGGFGERLFKRLSPQPDKNDS